jgi:hypothetical protein
MKLRPWWLMVASSLAIAALLSHSVVTGLSLESTFEVRLSDIRIELPDPTFAEECNTTCVICVDDDKHFNVVAPPSSPAGSAGPVHETCEDDHDCECIHDCDPSLSCFRLQVEVERAIELLAEATEAEVIAFLAANGHAVLINPVRNALQFLGCRESEVIAHLPMKPALVQRLLSG